MSSTRAAGGLVARAVAKTRLVDEDSETSLIRARPKPQDVLVIETVAILVVSYPSM